MIKISNADEYADNWSKESEQFESNDVYKKLSDLSPKGNVLEFGCGTGNGTFHLVKERNVLAFDSNKKLIDQASDRLTGSKNSYCIHECDFFYLGASEKKLIMDFQPEIIVGWFIGSHGEDIFKHTNEEPNPITKSKIYREKIEDIIISPDVCIDSVQYIHLASRGEIVVGFTKEEIFNSQKEDYDTYVFNKIGFEVIEVDSFEWVRDSSEFIYGQAHNPNVADGKVIPMITSIVAKRIQSEL
ncbi:hypothetical protein [Aeromonas veronii]|uniref:hypothetical protein n=1 Tax=Aeromonas veronii TaxID=654 RepID=UPI003BA060FB